MAFLQLNIVDICDEDRKAPTEKGKKRKKKIEEKANNPTNISNESNRIESNEIGHGYDTADVILLLIMRQYFC